MKKLLFIIFILIVSCVSIGATTITVSTVNVPNANFAGTTCTLRIYASQNFVTSASQQIIGSSVGSSSVYKSVSCTKSGSTVTIPQFTIDSTTDALVNPNARYSAVIYDQSGTARINYLMNFVVPTSLGTTVSWAQLIVYNQGNTLVNPPTTYLKANEVAALIAANEAEILASESVQNKIACFNPEHYGASGEDSSDDTSIITTVIAAANSAGGGTVCFSEGTYRTTGNIALPDNVTIQGATGGTLLATGATKILLTATNASIFTIGERREGINFKDIELQASSTTGTSGVKITGAYPESSQLFTFFNVVFRGFAKGIYVLATDGSKDWQASYAKVTNAVFYGNTNGIWIEARNSEWHIDGSVFYPPASGNGIWCETCGVLTVRNTYNNGPGITPVCTAEGSAPAYTPTYDTGLANSFVTINGGHGNVLIETSHNEGAKFFLVNNYEELTFPILVTGSSINDIRLNADAYFISKGNRLYVNSVVATGATNDTRIFSEGDRIYQVGADQQTKCVSNGTGTGFITSGGVKIVTKTVFNGFTSPMTTFFGDLVEPANSADTDFTTGKVQIGLDSTYAVQGKPFFTMGETSSGSFTQKFEFFRNQTNGALTLRPSQSAPNKIFEIDGALQLKKQTTYSAPEVNTAKLVLDTNNFLRLCVNTQSTCDVITEINPRWFGAKGDNSTDDTVAIQYAIDNAAGNKILISPGTYLVTELSLINNTHIILSPGATIKQKSGTDTKAVFLVRDLTNVTIEGSGTIDANSGGGAVRSTGILVQGGSRLQFKGFTVKNADDTGSQRGDGIYLGMGFNVITPPTDVVIDGVTSTTNDRQALSVIGCKQCRIVNNTLKDTTGVGEGVGIDLEPNPDKRSVTDGVTNSTTTLTSATANFVTGDVGKQVVIGVPAGGEFITTIASRTNATTVELTVAPNFTASSLSVLISDIAAVFQDVVISNNTIVNNTGGGILLANTNRAPHNGIIITGNTIRGNGRKGAVLGLDMATGVVFANNNVSGSATMGVELASCNKGVTIAGNDISSNTTIGLSISGCNHASVIGNRITLNGTNGIDIRTDTQVGSIGANGIITGNQIYNNGITTVNTYDGIYISGRTDSNTGYNIALNQIGNDPNIRYIASQRYGIYNYGSGGSYAANNASIFNTFIGNLTDKIYYSTGTQTLPVIGFSDYSSTAYQNLILSNGDTATSGSSYITPTYRPAQITGNTNNYAEVNNKAYVIELTANGNYDVTGIVAGVKGERHLLYNDGSSALTLKNESASSTAANRIQTQTGGDFILQPAMSVPIYYNTVYSRWYIETSNPLLAGSATLNFDLTAVATQDLTITVTGSAVGDVCSLGVPNGSITADTIFSCWVSASNTVTVRAMRIAGTPDPASGTFKVKVSKQ